MAGSRESTVMMSSRARRWYRLPGLRLVRTARLWFTRAWRCLNGQEWAVGKRASLGVESRDTDRIEPLESSATDRPTGPKSSARCQGRQAWAGGRSSGLR